MWLTIPVDVKGKYQQAIRETRISDLMTGLSNARGEVIFLIDCDLEEDPELSSTFYEAFQSSNAGVVYGVQDKPKGA